MPKVVEFMNTETTEGRVVSFDLGEDGNLYIDGKQVVTKQKVTLNTWLNVSIILGSIGALAQGIVAVVTIL